MSRRHRRCRTIRVRWGPRSRSSSTTAWASQAAGNPDPRGVRHRRLERPRTSRSCRHRRWRPGAVARQDHPDHRPARAVQSRHRRARLRDLVDGGGGRPRAEPDGLDLAAANEYFATAMLVIGRPCGFARSSPVAEAREPIRTGREGQPREEHYRHGCVAPGFERERTSPMANPADVLTTNKLLRDHHFEPPGWPDLSAGRRSRRCTCRPRDPGRARGQLEQERRALRGRCAVPDLARALNLLGPCRCAASSTDLAGTR